MKKKRRREDERERKKNETRERKRKRLEGKSQEPFEKSVFEELEGRKLLERTAQHFLSGENEKSARKSRTFLLLTLSPPYLSLSTVSKGGKIHSLEQSIPRKVHLKVPALPNFACLIPFPSSHIHFDCFSISFFSLSPSFFLLSSFSLRILSSFPK